MVRAPPLAGGRVQWRPPGHLPAAQRIAGHFPLCEHWMAAHALGGKRHEYGGHTAKWRRGQIYEGRFRGAGAGRPAIRLRCIGAPKPLRQPHTEALNRYFDVRGVSCAKQLTPLLCPAGTLHVATEVVATGYVDESSHWSARAAGRVLAIGSLPGSSPIKQKWAAAAAHIMDML